MTYQITRWWYSVPINFFFYMFFSFFFSTMLNENVRTKTAVYNDADVFFSSIFYATRVKRSIGLNSAIFNKSVENPRQNAGRMKQEGLGDWERKRRRLEVEHDQMRSENAYYFFLHKYVSKTTLKLVNVNNGCWWLSFGWAWLILLKIYYNINIAGTYFKVRCEQEWSWVSPLSVHFAWYEQLTVESVLFTMH